MEIPATANLPIHPREIARSPCYTIGSAQREELYFFGRRSNDSFPNVSFRGGMAKEDYGLLVKRNFRKKIIFSLNDIISIVRQKYV